MKATSETKQDKYVLERTHQKKLKEYQEKVKSIIDKLSAERKALRERIQSLENATSGTQEQVHKDQLMELEQLKLLLKDKDAQIDDMYTQMADLLTENSKLKEQLEFKEQEINNLREQLKSKSNKALRESMDRKWTIGTRKFSTPSLQPPNSSSASSAEVGSVTSPASSPPSSVSNSSPLAESGSFLNLSTSPKSPPRSASAQPPTMKRTQSTNGMQANNNSGVLAAVGRSKSELSPEYAQEELEPPDEDMIVEVNQKTGQAEVRGGTLVKLVERLCYHKVVGRNHSDFVAAFMMTYRSFTTPEILLDLLIARFNITAPPELTGAELETWESNKKIIQFRVANALKYWLDKYWRDFEENAELKSKAEAFIKGPLSAYENISSSLLKFFDPERTPSSKEVTVLGDPPPPITPKSPNFIDWDPVEVARQIARIEHALFSAIRETEFLNQNWSKEDRDVLAPNIVALIKRFNLVSTWVATTIVKEEKMKNRVNLVKNFIKIAQECKQIANFNGVMEILAGLQNAAIWRLKKTWEKVESSAKINETFQELLDLMGTSENYKAYRTKLKQVTTACIPYLGALFSKILHNSPTGMYLTDLTFIGDGNPDILNGRQDLINFDKRRKIAFVISEIKQWQQLSYNFAEEKTIADYMMSIEGLTEKALYKYSLICEPRGGRDINQRGFSTQTLFKKFKFNLTE